MGWSHYTRVESRMNSHLLRRCCVYLIWQVYYEMDDLAKLPRPSRTQIDIYNTVIRRLQIAMKHYEDGEYIKALELFGEMGIALDHTESLPKWNRLPWYIPQP